MVLIAGGLAAVVVNPETASASTGTAVVGTTALTQVACASATVCIAVGYEPPPPGGIFFQGVMVPLHLSAAGAVTAGPAQAVPDFDMVSHVVCPSPTTCMVAGYGTVGQEMTEPITVSSSGTLTTSTPASGPSLSEDIGFACAGGTCIGMSYYTVVSVAYRVTPAGQEQPAVPIILPNNGIAGLACASATVCMATSTDGLLVPIVVSASGLTIGSYEPLGGSGGPIACASANLCLAAVSGSSGTKLVPLGVSSSGAITVGTAPPATGAPGPLPGASEAGSTFACPTAEVCESLGSDASGPGPLTEASVSSSGTAAYGTPPVPAVGGNALACPTATTCVTVGTTSSSGVVTSVQVPYPSVAPTSGPSAGSVWTDITGTNLSPAGASCVYYEFSACTGVNVYFGSTPAFIVYDSPTLIVVLTPAEPAGTVEVTVKGSGASSTLIGEYTYT